MHFSRVALDCRVHDIYPSQLFAKRPSEEYDRMKTTGSLLTILTALTLPLCASAQRAEPDGLIDSGKIVVAINDFVGTERKSARQLSEILLSDLAKQHLQTVERADLRQTFDDLEITTGVALTAAQVRKAGGAVHATRFVVGAFSRDDADRFVIKARVLDAATGAPIADKALTLVGEPDDLPALAHRLAKQLVLNLQDSEETFESPVQPSADYRKGEPPVEDAINGDPPIKPVRKSTETPIERDSLALFRSEGLVPESAEEVDSVSESEFATLMSKLSKRVSVQNERPFTMLHPAESVTRLRAVVALVKLIVPANEILASREVSSEKLPSDARSIPIWGVSYVGIGVEKGWLSSSKTMRPRDIVNWQYLAQLLSKLDIEEEKRRPVPIQPLLAETQEAYTGLIVDTREFDLQRERSPRILDEDGNEVYPDPKHLPAIDYVEDQGMANYNVAVADADRAGKRPLIVKAVALSGNFNVVISNASAEKIRIANRKGRFLWAWKVSFLVHD